MSKNTQLGILNVEETSNNKYGKSPYVFSKLMETTNINILNVVVMMRMTMQVLSNFMKMLT